jgi:hypothetical protein
MVNLSLSHDGKIMSPSHLNLHLKKYGNVKAGKIIIGHPTWNIVIGKVIQY